MLGFLLRPRVRLIGGPGPCTQGGSELGGGGRPREVLTHRSNLKMAAGTHTLPEMAQGAGPQMPRDSFHPRLHNLVAAAKV